MTYRNSKSSPSQRKASPSKSDGDQNYWTKETEAAVKKYLEMDVRFLTSKMEEYLKKRKKTFDDETIEDGRLAEFHNRIEWSETEGVQNLKNSLFKRYLETPLNELVEQIIFKYELFRYDIDVKTAHNECLGHIYEKFANFDPYKGNKSYSYYGTMAKHYCMNEIRKSYESQTKLLDYEEHKPEVDSKRVENLNTDDIEFNEEIDIVSGLFSHIKELLEDEIKKGSDSKWMSNDITVAKALVYILSEHRRLGVYNKVDIYKEIAEETKLQRKEINYSLARIRVFYRMRKESFIKNTEE